MGMSQRRVDVQDVDAVGGGEVGERDHWCTLRGPRAP
jgi:hypothetical protein